MNSITIKFNRLFDKLTSTAIGIIFTFSLILLGTERLIAKLIFLINGSINNGAPFYLEMSLIDQFIWTVIMGPLFETIIFHFILMEILIHIFNKVAYGNWWVVSISAILFGSIHYYSIDYIIIAVIAGVVLSIAYIVAKKRNMIAFLVVFAIHAIHNFISWSLYGYKAGLIF
ncbi:MAG: type II CAAX prenyl endopeptidase Rce1 family protein [Bacteroidales bacterium]